MKRKAYLLAALVLAAGLAAAMMQGAERQASITIEAIKNSEILGLRVVNRKSGEEAWTFRSERAMLADENSLAYLTNVNVYFPKNDIKVVSDAGVYDMDTKDLALSGNVMADTGRYVLMTNTISLEGENDIYTDDGIHVIGNDMDIVGQGLRTDLETWVTKNVTATFK